MAEVLRYNLDLEPRSRWEIVTVHPFARSELLYVQEAGDFRCGKNYFTVREGLDSYLMKLTLSGKGLLDYENGRYELTAGRFFWIDCQKPQNYRTDPETGHWHVLWVHFFGANAGAYYGAFQSLSGGSPVGTLPVGGDAADILESLLAVYEKQGGSLEGDVRASALLTSLLAACVQAVTVREAGSAAPEVVRKVKSYLFEHCGERITLESLEERFSVSRFHLQKLFKRHVGQSPAEYLGGIRLMRAKELLRTTELPVGEIAYRVGMESPSYFIRVFRAQEGTTPRKFRESWSNTGNGEQKETV